MKRKRNVSQVRVENASKIRKLWYCTPRGDANNGCFQESSDAAVQENLDVVGLEEHEAIESADDEVSHQVNSQPYSYMEFCMCSTLKGEWKVSPRFLVSLAILAGVYEHVRTISLACCL